jgi:hypothetical protein
VGNAVNNTDRFGAGFGWQRSKSVAKGDSWLRDLALALIVAVASSFLLMIGNAYSKPCPSLQITSMVAAPHDQTVISATVSVD